MTPFLFDAPIQGTLQITAQILHHQKRESIGYFSHLLHLFLCSWHWSLKATSCRRHYSGTLI